MTICLMMLSILPGLAQKKPDMNQFYPIDAGHSYIEFSIKYMGYAKVRGRFAEYSGMFRFDENDITNTSVTLTIKTKSIDSDLEFRDDDLKSENWFDAEKFPTISFSSKKVTKTMDGFDLIGDLTIKAVTKEVSLHLDPASGVLKDIRGDAQVIFTGKTSINRAEYGVEGKNWSAVKEGITAVDNEVSIEFSILGKQQKTANLSNRLKNDQWPAGKVYKMFREQGLSAGLAGAQKLMTESALDENSLILAGQMYLLEGKVDDAIKIQETNREMFPGSSNVHFNVGEAWAVKGDWTKAKESFEQALKLDPANSKAIEVLKNLK